MHHLPDECVRHWLSREADPGLPNTSRRKLVRDKHTAIVGGHGRADRIPGNRSDDVRTRFQIEVHFDCQTGVVQMLKSCVQQFQGKRSFVSCNEISLVVKMAILTFSSS